MIANPSTPAFRYDPYDKKFTREGYEHEEMRELRGKAVRQARRNVRLDRPANDKSGQSGTKFQQDGAADVESTLGGSEGASGWSVVLGTLGRQGSLSVLKVSRKCTAFSMCPDKIAQNSRFNHPCPSLHSRRTCCSFPNCHRRSSVSSQVIY